MTVDVEKNIFFRIFQVSPRYTNTLLFFPDLLYKKHSSKQRLEQIDIQLVVSMFLMFTPILFLEMESNLFLTFFFRVGGFNHQLEIHSPMDFFVAPVFPPKSLFLQDLMLPTDSKLRDWMSWRFGTLPMIASFGLPLRET